jgi:arylsulfatase A-like enzyme
MTSTLKIEPVAAKHSMCPVGITSLISRSRAASTIACVFAFAINLYAAPASSLRPNIVVILIDDMGFSDLGCYGSEIPTPNVDALADGGLRFTQFYNTARCSPTRASLLTGLYPHQAGLGFLESLVRPNSKGTQGKLRNDCVTIAEVLAPAGYFTIMTGKWHLGHTRGVPAASRGFTRSLSSPIGELYFSNQKQRREDGVFLNGQRLDLDDPQLGSKWYGPDLLTEWGLKFIDEAIAAGKPFFYYLPHSSVHFPLQVPKADFERYRGKYKIGWDKLREARHRRQIEMRLVDPKWPLSPLPPDVPAWETLGEKEHDRYDKLMAVYAAMIDRLDGSIGTLVEGLKARDQFDNTLILVLADNGGNAEAGPDGRLQGKRPGGPGSTVFLGQCWATLNNTPLRRYKHFTHEGGISTPLIAHWPAGIPRERNGQLEHQPGHLIDIMATVVDMTDAVYPTEYTDHAIQPMEGVSLLPAFAGKPLEREAPIFWEHEGNRAVRSGKWKLVMKYKGPWELYDIEADRTEQHNLIDQQPEVAKKLIAQWEAWAERSDVDQWTGPARTDWGEELKQPAKDEAKSASL